MSATRTTLAAALLVSVLPLSSTFAEESPGPSFGEDDVAREEQPTQALVPIEGCREIHSLARAEVAVHTCADGRVVIDGPDGRDLRITTAPVEALFERDGEVWVITRQHLATPVNELPGLIPATEGLAATPHRVEPSAGEPEPLPEPDAVRGEVVRFELGRVVINLGTDDGLRVGDRVEFFVEEPVQLIDGRAATRVETLAIAPVRSVTKTHAEVYLGLNERVSPDAQVHPTTRPQTHRELTPSRLGSQMRTSLTVRPFLALGTLGAGTISEAFVAYQLAGPWTVEALFEPLAFGVARDANLLALTGTGIFSYDTTLFQVGLGVGVTTYVEDSGYRPVEPGEEVGMGLAPAISQKIRLGALEGLHLEVMNAFFLASDAFEYGGTTVRVQVPTSRAISLGGRADATWIVARGGGSAAGHGFGEVGLRVLVRGNGDRGSVFFTPTVGAGYLSGVTTEECDLYYRPDQESPDDQCVTSVGYGGPMIGFQVEWRP